MTPREIFDRQMEYLQAKAVDPLIDNNYNEDAELISLVGDPFVVKGSAALKTHFRNYLAQTGDFQEIVLTKVVESEDTFALEAQVTLNQNGIQIGVYDAFHLQNGKIARHFTGIK
jgi:hypothetical protein